MRALSLIAMLLLAGAAQAQDTGGTLAKLRTTGRIGLGIRDRSLPFGYVADGRPVGYGIDMCIQVVAALERQLGTTLQVDLHPVQSVTRFSFLENGTIDLDCGTTSNTRERQGQVAFSNTYFLTASSFVARRGSGIDTIEALRGRKVSITANTTNLEQLRSLDAARNLGLELVVTPDTGEGFRTFASGAADAFVADEILVAALVASSPDPGAYIVGREHLSGSEPYAIMLRRGDPAFKAAVDEATSALLRSDAGKQLYAKWFEQPLPGRAFTMGLPMAPELRQAFDHPTDSADPAQYVK